MNENGSKFTPQYVIEQIQNLRLVGRVTEKIAEETHPVIHHYEELQNYHHWLEEGNSLIVTYGPHTNIWDFPVPEEKLIPLLVDGKSDPNKHAVIVSAKFDSVASRTVSRRKRLRVPHMGVANLGLKEYASLKGVTVVYMVPDTLKDKLMRERTSDAEKEEIVVWAKSMNDSAINDLTQMLDQDGAIVEYFPEATRHGNTFIRAEPLLDVFFYKFRHNKTRSLGVSPVALFGLEHIQQSGLQGTVIGVNPNVNLDLDVLPLHSVRELYDATKLYHWRNGSKQFREDSRVYLSDIVMKQLSMSQAVPSSSNRTGDYADLVEIV